MRVAGGGDLRGQVARGGIMAVSNKPTGRKAEPEGPYTKLIALGTILLVVLGYVAISYPAHWVPFSPSPAPTIAASRPRPIITSPAPAPATTPPAPTPAETGIPAAYRGTWEGGIVYQGVSDEISMSLNQGPVGTQVGQFMNDTLDCQASVYLEGGNGPIYLRLILTSNPENVCVPFVYAQAILTSSGLNFALEDTSQVSPSEPMSNGMLLSGTLGRSP